MELRAKNVLGDDGLAPFRQTRSFIYWGLLSKEKVPVPNNAGTFLNHGHKENVPNDVCKMTVQFGVTVPVAAPPAAAMAAGLAATAVIL